MIQYYFFLQKLQFAIVARFLLLISPAYLFIESKCFFSIANFASNFIPDYLLTIFVFLIIPIFYAYSVMYVFRSISFKDYAIYRSGKMSDDIGFAIVYVILIGVICFPLLQIVEPALYKFISLCLIQIATLYFLFKIKIYNYSVEKRDQPLKT